MSFRRLVGRVEALENAVVEVDAETESNTTAITALGALVAEKNTVEMLFDEDNIGASIAPTTDTEVATVAGVSQAAGSTVKVEGSVSLVDTAALGSDVEIILKLKRAGVLLAAPDKFAKTTLFGTVKGAAGASINIGRNWFFTNVLAVSEDFELIIESDVSVDFIHSNLTVTVVS